MKPDIKRHTAEVQVSHMLNATMKVVAVEAAKQSLAWRMARDFLKTDAQCLMMFRPQAVVRLTDQADIMYCTPKESRREYDVYRLSGYTYNYKVEEPKPIQIVSIEEIDALCHEFYHRTSCHATHIFLPPHCRLEAYNNILTREFDANIGTIYDFKIVENAQTLAVGIL